MARSHFGGTSVDWLLRPYPFGGTTLMALKTGTTTLDFYSAETGGTHYTDLLNAAAGAVSQVSVSGHQVPDFQGPDGILAMWADKGDGSPREKLEAQDLAAAAAAVAAAEAAQAAAEDARDDAVSAADEKVAKGDLVIDLFDYNVKPANSAATNVSGFAAAVATGATNFFLRAGTYAVQLTEGGDLMSFASKAHLRIRGDNAILSDTTTYTNNGAFTCMIKLDACSDVEVSGIQYTGPSVGTPSTLLGYQGAIFVRAINACNGVKVDATLTNLRYGVQTGQYDDASKGLCRNFDLKLRTTMVGYPLAAYYADGIRHDIDADGVHRVVYIAGCNDVTGVARWKNAYIASPTYLLTDCLTSGTDTAAQAAPPANPTTSRACTNIDVASIEGSSTTWPTGDTFCAGILPSRVDAMQYRNIKVRVHSVAESNSVSATTGAFIVLSAAKTIWNRYAFNWESTVVIENVDISGLIDHSAASVAGQDLYLIAFESTHAATIRNFRDDNLAIIPSSAAAQVRITPRLRSDPWELESGQSSMPRGDINSTAVLSTTGTIRLGCFIAEKTFVTTQARMITGSTAAAATPSLVKFCLFSIAPNGDLTRVAVTASDTAIFATVNTAYTKAWATPYTMIAGRAYAAGFLVVTGAAAPTVAGHGLASTTDALLSPRMSGLVSDTDVASSYGTASFAVNSQRPYIAILP